MSNTHICVHGCVHHVLSSILQHHPATHLVGLRELGLRGGQLLAQQRQLVRSALLGGSRLLDGGLGLAAGRVQGGAQLSHWVNGGSGGGGGLWGCAGSR